MFSHDIIKRRLIERHTIATYIRADHRDVVHTRHPEDPGDRLAEMVPLTEVVSEPLAHTRSCARECRACDDERALARAARQHSIVRRGGHHCAVQVVRVVLDQAVRVERIRLHDVSISARPSHVLRSMENSDLRRQFCQTARPSQQSWRWHMAGSAHRRGYGQHAY